jgi:hypothetical protein
MLIEDRTLSSALYCSSLNIVSKQDDFVRGLRQNGRMPDAARLSILPSFHIPRNGVSEPRIWPIVSRDTNRSKQPLGSSIVLHKHWNLLCSIYSVSCLLRLPFILVNYCISINASIQWFFAGWPTVSHSISVKNIVPADSRFMMACDEGNTRLVWEMMMKGMGRATDIDEFGIPTLHVSASKTCVQIQNNRL